MERLPYFLENTSKRKDLGGWELYIIGKNETHKRERNCIFACSTVFALSPANSVCCRQWSRGSHSRNSGNSDKAFESERQARQRKLSSFQACLFDSFAFAFCRSGTRIRNTEMTKATNKSTNTKEKASPPSKEKKEKKESQEKKSFFQRWMQFHFSSKKYFSEVLQGEVFPAKYLFFFFLGISFCFFATISFILFYNEMELSNILSILLLIVLAFTGIIFLPLFLEFLLCRSLGGLQSFRKYLLCWGHFLFFIFLDLFFFGVLFVGFVGRGGCRLLLEVGR